jgi:hypothetical protein
MIRKESSFNQDIDLNAVLAGMTILTLLTKKGVVVDMNKF